MVQADRRNNNSKAEKKEELVEKLVHINRVAKTVKGGIRKGGTDRRTLKSRLGFTKK